MVNSPVGHLHQLALLPRPEFGLLAAQLAPFARATVVPLRVRIRSRSISIIWTTRSAQAMVSGV